MARKQSISKESLLDQAVKIAEEQGILAVTSRSVAQAAGCSIQPVFSHFPTMEELRKQTFLHACQIVEREYMDDLQQEEDGFDSTIRRILGLARTKPNLYKLCYLSGNDYSVGPENPAMAFQSNRMFLQKLQAESGLDIYTCQNIFMRSLMMIYGIATMICVNGIECSDDMAREMIHRTLEDMIFAASAKNIT
ncbi:MAG: TetR family transcriptional regulator [Lachnospiraceae bacterium]|nr:TetR family transcriptional regulator [Lachnospiraceae bacterium]